MVDRVVSEEEQKEAEQYVLERELYRPKTSILTVLKYYFIFCICILVLTVLIVIFLRFVFPDLAYNIEHIFSEKPFLVFIITWAVFHVIGFIIFLKQMVIGFVHLYQHYSPEDVRRSCLFKPTCSEFMILAIEKYGLLKGLNVSVDRFEKCNGETYSVDYP